MESYQRKINMPRHKGSRNIIPTDKVKRMIVNQLTEQALAGNPFSAGVFLELDRRGYFDPTIEEDNEMKNKNTFNPMQGAKETSLRKQQPTMPKPDADSLEQRRSNNNFSWGNNPVVDSSGAKSD